MHEKLNGKVLESCRIMEPRQIKAWGLLSISRLKPVFRELIEIDETGGLQIMCDCIDACREFICDRIIIRESDIERYRAATGRTNAWCNDCNEDGDAVISEGKSKIECGLSKYHIGNSVLDIDAYLRNITSKMSVEHMAGIISESFPADFFLDQFETNNLNEIKRVAEEIRMIWDDTEFVSGNCSLSQLNERALRYSESEFSYL